MSVRIINRYYDALGNRHVVQLSNGQETVGKTRENAERTAYKIVYNRFQHLFACAVHRPAGAFDLSLSRAHRAIPSLLADQAE